MSDRRMVSTGSPYEPIIGLSRAVRIGNTIAVAGTAPLGPDGKTVGRGDVAAQTRRCFEIIEAALAEAECSLGDIVRTRLYIVDVGDFDAVKRVHGELLGDVRPACTGLVVAGLLDPRWKVEIEADAVRAAERAPLR